MKGQVIVSAGDAITAKLVEQAGFDGIWISGFEASARLGLPDNGSITMFEMLNIAKPIVDSLKIPVWVDVDTGYGNFQRTVREFERIGVTGVCIEDNIPELKINSLWGDKLPLMDMKEFAHKIFVGNRKIKIIARTEALIRGYGMDECRKRLEYYWKYGACDILLPHSRDEKEILHDKLCYLTSEEYPAKRNFIPMAIVPTKFPQYTNKQLFGMGYLMVIWANQTERVKIKAMREALKSLKDNDCALDIENNLSATLEDMRGLTLNE